MNRKIELPDYMCAASARFNGHDPDCEHDYPPESRKDYDAYGYTEWVCAKCGGVVKVDHLDH